MFTGLVEATAKVLKVEPQKSGNIELTVEKPSIFNDLAHGHSVAHNGVCLTIKDKNPENLTELTYDLGLETLKVTTFKNIKEGDILNLERPLMMGERLHGHLVTGHVDETAEVKKVEVIKDGCAVIFISSLTKPEFTWAKGSIVIDGVSLTINEVSPGLLSVCLVPETLVKTNLSSLTAGDKVNIEYDFYAKGVIHAAKSQ